MPTKMPTAKEVLTDPKFSEQKGFFKELFGGLVEEMRDEEKKKRKSEDDGANLWDTIFGGGS